MNLNDPNIAPLMIPLGAFALALGIVLVTAVQRYHLRKLQSDERMAAIARGLPVPPEPSMHWDNHPYDVKRSAANTRKGGIVLVSIGLGIIAGLVLISYTVGVREVLTGCIGGIIPLFIGIGLLIDYLMQVRDIERDATAAKQEERVHA